MSDDRGDDRDCPPGAEPRRTEVEPGPPDAAEAEPSGWVASVRRNRPVLYAARHLIKPLVQLAMAIVGIGALLRAVLPRIEVDMEWVDSWGREHLSRVPDPLGWAARWLGDRFGEVQVTDWLWSVLRNAKWWLPILVAVGVGIGEVLGRWEAAGTPRDPSPADEDDDDADESERQSDADGHANAPHLDDEPEGLP